MRTVGYTNNLAQPWRDVELIYIDMPHAFQCLTGVPSGRVPADPFISSCDVVSEASQSRAVVRWQSDLRPGLAQTLQ